MSRIILRRLGPLLFSALALLACSPEQEKASGAAHEGSTRLRFVDATAASGLDFIHETGATGELYLPEITGAGGALIDYDNDGDLDLYLAQGVGLGPLGEKTSKALFSDRLYRNDLSGPGREARFVDVTRESRIPGGGYGMGVATGDFDGDGWTDLYVTNLGSNRLLRNLGDGTFDDATQRAGVGDEGWSVSAVFFDLDNDGFLDLFVGNYVDFAKEDHQPCFQANGGLDYCGPLAFDPVPDRLFRNRGDGTFDDVTRAAGLRTAFGSALGAAAGDFDGDGWPDLYVANDQMPNHLWVNGGDRTFEDRALLSGCSVNGEGLAESSMGIAVGDYDGDGDPDILLSHLRQESSTLYRNLGSGLFEDATAASALAAPSLPFTGFGTGFFDPDNDGFLDLFVANGAVRIIPELAAAGDPHPLHQANQLFANRSGERFEEVSSEAGDPFGLSEVSRGALFGDLDNDGDTDLIVTNNGGPARLLLNVTESPHHWIGLRLIGAGGRDMLGARVEILAPGRETLLRRVTTSGSYASAGDPRVLIGLGEDEGPVTVRALWPGGLREEWSRLEVDRYLTLAEGSGKTIG